MSAGYEIVKYAPPHKPLVACLQTHLWSSDVGRNACYLEWKYERNPGPDGALIYLALHGDEVVGMRGFHPATLEAGTPSYTFHVLIAGDALVAPGHRDKGLVTRIMKAAYADLTAGSYRFFLSVGGANRVNTFGLLTLGWKSAGALSPMGRIAKGATARAKLNHVMAQLPWLWRFRGKRFLYSAAQRHPFRRLDAAKRGRASNAAPPIAIEATPRIDAMAALVKRLGHDGRVRYVRDPEYLAWRYQSPLSDFRFLYWGDAHLEGYLVLSTRASDLGSWYRVYIADLEASDIKIRSELLAAAIRWGQFPELVTWAASLGTAEIQLLKDHGFEPVDAHDTERGCPCVLVRPLGQTPSAADWMLGDRTLLDPGTWDIRLLYSMRA